MKLLAACALASSLAIVAVTSPVLAQKTPLAPAEPPADAAPAAPPASDFLPKVTLDDITTALQDAGYRAQLKEDNQGSYVASASSGNNFFASLGACDDQQFCKSMLLETAGWTPKTPPTVESLNKFHSDNGGWVAVVTYSDGKYYANWRVPLVGGVSKAWLQYTVEAFAATTDNFVAFMQK